jgi:hypothetical protein
MLVDTGSSRSYIPGAFTRIGVTAGGSETCHTHWNVFVDPAKGLIPCTHAKTELNSALLINTLCCHFSNAFARGSGNVAYKQRFPTARGAGNC